jgi:hypothetical protein
MVWALLMFFFDGTSSEGGELPHCIIGRGKVVQLIRETGPKDHTCTVNQGKTGEDRALLMFQNDVSAPLRKHK